VNRLGTPMRQCRPLSIQILVTVDPARDQPLRPHKASNHAHEQALEGTNISE
jgi:hypothetical protein